MTEGSSLAIDIPIAADVTIINVSSEQTQLTMLLKKLLDSIIAES